MWVWGCVERVAAGLLGPAGAHGGRWDTAVAVGVTAAAGLALVAIIVSSRRGGLKSPWRRRRRKATLTAQEWRSLFTPEGKFHDGGVKLLKKVRGGGIEPSIRAQVWPFLLGVYSLDGSEAERGAIKAQNRKGYLLLRKHCLRKSVYNNEVSNQLNETARVNHEESVGSEKGKGSVSPVGSEEVPEQPSAEEHLTSEEENPEVNSEQEMKDETAKTIPEKQMDESLSSSSSFDEDESEKSDVTHVEASHKDVASVHQSPVEDEQESMPRYSNTGGNTEIDNELSKAARPVKSARTIEDFETWQRIIRLDAVRANDEWVSYCPSQAAVSREKAIESAKAVCLKDYEHLESHRIHHASRLVAILEAYAIYDPEIGYCQGMSDLLAPLLAVLEEDDEAFWCFAGFMRKARHNFRLDEVGIRRQLNMVSKIIKHKDFHLYRHLEMLQAEDCFFVYRMVVVLFRRELTFEQTLSLWEVMWADQAAHRAGIAKSSWGKLLLAAPPTDDLLLYAIAASVLQKRKLIIESYSSMDGLEEKLLRLFASVPRAVLNPMAAMSGGIVGQEVMKAYSGKFHPHYQFFYFDSVESLPTYPLDPKDLKPLNSRYDAQISVFGSKLQKKMRDANVFVVGSGALGCEFLKNLALMGVSCGHKGTLTITDDDVIEKSNLSRQFLFRDWNIGQAKSTVAAAAAGAINSSLHIDALQNRACPETEHVFPDAFWEGLDVVINALDNVNARMYMDMRCLYFQKPLLESGTLGAKCNTQMVIPHLTENYGASRDPPEKQAPMCTVHSFPHNIDHCLTWARSEFEGLLEKTPNEVNSFMSNPAQYAAAMRKAGDAQSRELLQRVCECLDKERCERFEDCITWARLKFEDYFANRVKQLTFTFPEDAATSTGALFWSAPKRFPHPLQFSAVDSSHIHFILAASILRAVSFGIPIPDWAKNTSDLVDTVSKVVVPEFEPKRGVKIETDEKATNLSSASVDDAAVIEDLLTKLEACAKKLSPGFQMKPIQFEKDDDTNFHMDLIAGLANMRARNYGIQEVDKLKAKFIAGRIIPAIATSTAMATGLVCLELYKVLAGGHPVEDYRNTFANLALPMLTMAEPLPPKVIKHQDMRWTAWDRWSIEGNITIAELLKWLSDKGLSAYSVSCGTSLLYNTMFTRHKDRLNKKIVDVAKEVAKLDVPAYRRHLDVVVACEDDDGNDIDIPLISIYFR